MSAPISVKVDVTKLDKARFFKGKKGTYVDLVLIPYKDGPDQFDNDYFVKQEVSREEREKGVQLPILGSARVIQKRGGGPPPTQRQAQAKVDDEPTDSDEVPF